MTANLKEMPIPLLATASAPRISVIMGHLNDRIPAVSAARAGAARLLVIRGISTTRGLGARLPSPTPSAAADSLLPSFDELGPLFGRDPAESRPHSEGHLEARGLAHDMFNEQPLHNDDAESGTETDLDGGLLNCPEGKLRRRA